MTKSRFLADVTFNYPDFGQSYSVIFMVIAYPEVMMQDAVVI